MNHKKLLSLVVILLLLAEAAFGQEQTGLASSIKSLIDSGIVEKVTVANSVGNPFQTSASARTLEIRAFSVSQEYQLVLELGNIKFTFDLTRVIVYSYDSKLKHLIIWMI